MGKLNHRYHISIIVDQLLFKSLDLDLLVFILQYCELSPSIEQVKQLASIDLKEGDVELGTLVCILGLSKSEQVLNRSFIASLHSESLATTSLTIGKAGDNSSVKWEVNIGLNGSPVKLVVTLQL